ncbi:MAG: PIG-L deacetylase family protein [Bacillota bacterium]
MKPRICDFLPVPDLLSAKNILCIQPHPDDMEIGAGATIKKLSLAGKQVTALTITDGSAGIYQLADIPVDITGIRKSETEKSAKILGIEKLLWLDYGDGGNLPYEKIRSDITGMIRRIKPDAVMVCDPWLPYEAHSDHNRTGLAAAEACLLSGMPQFCPDDLQNNLMPHSVDMIAFYYTAYPNTFIDVSDTWETKLTAIDCHKSQFSGEKGKKLKEYLTTRSEEQAEETSCSLVEALKVLTAGHLHIFEETWQC